MPNEPLPVTQTPRALDTVISGGPTIAEAYLVAGGVGGRWLIDSTGPAAAYWNDTGVGSRYEVDSGAVAHDAFFKVINGRARVK